MNKLNLAIFASHSGSNMQSIIDSVNNGSLFANIVCFITNNSNCFAMERAKKENIPSYHVSSKTHPDFTDYKDELLRIINYHKADIIILAGYMKLLPTEIIHSVNGKVLNIHPALLPNYGGDGMFGMNVHNAVIKAGEKESGVTIHLVDSEYDKGKILAQAKCPVFKEDTPSELAKRVLTLEHKLYPETIQRIVRGELII